MKSVRGKIKSKQKFPKKGERANESQVKFSICLVYLSIALFVSLVHKYQKRLSLFLLASSQTHTHTNTEWNYIMEINKTLVGQFRIKVLSGRFTSRLSISLSYLFQLHTLGAREDEERERAVCRRKTATGNGIGEKEQRKQQQQ